MQRHISSTSPAGFAASVRALIEALVTACDREGPTHTSAFSAQAPFAQALPFLDLSDVAADPDVSLDPSNFRLQAVGTELPCPPRRNVSQT